MVNKRLQLGVFASGCGSNFIKIVEAVETGRLAADIRLLVTNNPTAGALDTATARGIETAVLRRNECSSRSFFVEQMAGILENARVDFVALAGYMRKIPPEIVRSYENRMLNIHPALLPHFGGKGMYGTRVHRAVREAGCKVSGVTVHLVDAVYDRGPIVAQRCVPVKPGDTVERLAARVLKEEHILYPQVLRHFARGEVWISGKMAEVVPESARQEN